MDLEKEVFDFVHGNDKYTVSDLGNVYSIRYNKNLKPTVTNGKAYVKLFKRYGDGKMKAKTYEVGFLVMRAFRPEGYSDLDQAKVMHKDGNGLNNRVENLMWYKC